MPAASIPPPSKPSSGGAPIRSAAVNALVGFLGAALVIPLAFKLGGWLLRGVGRSLLGLFKFSTGRRLIGEVVLAGMTALLTNEAVLDKLFGKKNTR